MPNITITAEDGRVLDVLKTFAISHCNLSRIIEEGLQTSKMFQCNKCEVWMPEDRSFEKDMSLFCGKCI